MADSAATHAHPCLSSLLVASPRARPARPTPESGTRLRRATSSILRPRTARAPHLARLLVRYRPHRGRHAPQGFDLRLTQYDDRGWRATFYTTGMEHSPTNATGTGWERTPWHATQRAAWEALKKVGPELSPLYFLTVVTSGAVGASATRVAPCTRASAVPFRSAKRRWASACLSCAARNCR